ncbi:HSP20-like chaperone [Backusella circina FSU 941]|nr:HSP20-like chaperone [Backusella circina FSU 941]
MALSSRLFHDTFRDMQRAMSQFDDAWYSGNSHFFETLGMNHPPSDLIEHKDQFEVHCEVPGFNKDDIHIELNGQTLNIRGTLETKTETRSEGTSDAANVESSSKNIVRKGEDQQQMVKNDAPRYWSTERQKKSFSRSFGFPTPVKSEGVKANYKDGILIVKVPKAESTSNRILIE